VRFARVSGDDGQTPVTAGGSVQEPCTVVYVVIAIIITIAFALLLWWFASTARRPQDNLDDE
jgi:hypothetical protein